MHRNIIDEIINIPRVTRVIVLDMFCVWTRIMRTIEEINISIAAVIEEGKSRVSRSAGMCEMQITSMRATISSEVTLRKIHFVISDI